ncbi:hypothetical protein MVEG_06059 [Podila verticillata NRRL 6337]|nr:hypothetical protein MVEG_06059 [Podila verticillata NRRL 6337]
MEDIFDTKDSVTTSDCLSLMTLSAFKSLVQAALQYRASDEISFTLMSKDRSAISIDTIAMQPVARKISPCENNHPGLAKENIIRAKDTVARTTITLSNDLKQHKALRKLKKSLSPGWQQIGSATQSSPSQSAQRF